MYVSIYLNYGGVHQIYRKQIYYKKPSPNAVEIIFQILKVAGVDEFSKLKGKTVRAESSFTNVKRIGHIINDMWTDCEEI